MSRPRIVLLDIETAPSLGWTWGPKWETNIIKFERHSYLLSFAYQWLEDSKIVCRCLPDFPRWESDQKDDSELMTALWDVLDEADLIIAHNGDRFDLPKINNRFIFHGMNPPSPYRTLDTLKLARKYFALDSNKLDDLGMFLGVGRKIPNTGAHLWFSCMSGEEKAFATMRKYNIQDVALLRRVYLKLRPWASNHPQLTWYSRETACPTCQSPKIQYRGFHVTRTGRRARIHCQSCGAWSIDKTHLKAA